MLREIHKLMDETDEQFLMSVSPLPSCVLLVLFLVFLITLSLL